MYDQPPAGLYCPDWRKSMVKVCPTCPLWVKVMTTARPDGSWNCAKAWVAILQVSAIAAAQSGAAATESFRNEMVQRADANRPGQAIAAARRIMIENGVATTTGFRDIGD